MSELTSELLMTAQVERVGTIPESIVSNNTARKLVVALAIARKKIPIPAGWERNPQVNVLPVARKQVSKGLLIYMLTGKELQAGEKQKVMTWEDDVPLAEFGAYVAMHSLPGDVTDADLVGVYYDKNDNIITLHHPFLHPPQDGTEELLLLIADGLIQASEQTKG
jgi:hypothetical protein